MKIIEQAVIGKTDSVTCEDGIVVNDNFAAVIDGSTSKTPFRVNRNMTNGRYCMELTCNYISRIPKDINLKDFCNGITRYIKNIYESLHLDLKRLKLHPAERLTASAVIYSSFWRQVWFIGDCQCLMNGRIYNNAKPSEAILAEKRASFLNNAINRGETSVEEVIEGKDCGRTFILNDLIESCKWQNISYPVIDGFPIPISHVKVVDIPASTAFLVLASDGYPVLCQTYAESEEALKKQLTSDPLCIGKFKATKGLRAGNKSFDDRSYLKVAI